MESPFPQSTFSQTALKKVRAEATAMKNTGTLKVTTPTEREITGTVLYSSREARGAARKTGMEQGVAASYDRLAEPLASMRT